MSYPTPQDHMRWAHRSRLRELGIEPKQAVVNNDNADLATEAKAIDEETLPVENDELKIQAQPMSPTAHSARVPSRNKKPKSNAPAESEVEPSEGQSTSDQPHTALPDRPTSPGFASLPPPPRPRAGRGKLVFLPEESVEASASQNLSMHRRDHVSRTDTFGKIDEFYRTGLQSRRSMEVDTVTSDVSESEESD
ncbi:hypothetical protein BJ912DRAFT_124189 [Pholiota molesta]|nr:hypothetical protein BJ912DRAFT_124189 [Pholiota molesta]